MTDTFEELDLAAGPGPGSSTPTYGGSPHLAQIYPRQVKLKITGSGIDKVILSGPASWAIEELDALLCNERVREVLVTFEVASEGAVAPAAPPPPPSLLPDDDVPYPPDFPFYGGVAWA